MVFVNLESKNHEQTSYFVLHLIVMCDRQSYL